MRKKKFKLSFCKLSLLVLACLFGSTYYSSLQAKDNSSQTVNQIARTIKGQVTDSKGEGIIGATVIVVGTNKGTVTDVDGNYSVELPTAKAQLKFTYIGYQPMTVTVGESNTLSVKLESDAGNLNEVIVVGYGTQKKASLSGSVFQISGDDALKGKSSTNVVADLQGEIPGLVITRSSSRPGNEGTNMQLRGGISVNGGTPLILIDGVSSAMWELEQINPNDIASISTLKDASASIYGTRAANGVILVTTKRGATSKVQISYSGSVHANLVGKRFPVATGSQWANMNIDATENDAIDGNKPNWWLFTEDQYRTMAKNQGFAEIIGSGRFTHIDPSDPSADQFDAVYGTTYGQDHNLSISAGNDKLRSLTSLGYSEDRSLIDFVFDGIHKYNFRSNVDYQATNWLKVAFNASYSSRKTTNPTQGVGSGVQDMFIFPLYNDIGQYYDVFGKNNLLAKMSEGGQTNNTENIFRVGASITADLGMLTKGLSLTANANVKMRNGYRKIRHSHITMYDWSDAPNGFTDNIFSQTSDANCSVQDRHADTRYQTFGGFANYEHTFGQHNLKLMGGSTIEQQSDRSLEVRVSGLQDDNLDDINTGDKSHPIINGSSSSQWALVSFLGRINYDYKGIYLLESTIRRDGSSQLYKDDRWSNFVGTSVGLRLSEFDFMKKNGIFNNLKLRASYGEMGNIVGIGTYDYVSTIGTGNAFFGYNGTPTTASWVNGISLRDRTWERVAATNFGLDFGVLGNRLSGSFDIFHNQNKGMLIAVVYPQTLGGTAPKTNAGDFTSNGFEVAVNWRDKIGSDFTYGVGVSLSNAITNVTKMDGALAINAGVNNPIQGKPLHSIYVYRTSGYLQNEAEVSAYYTNHSASGSIVPVQASVDRLTPGSVARVDLNDDGKITTSDLDYYGDSNPHYLFGVNLTASYKKFDFKMFIQGVGQQYVVRSGALAYPFAQGWTNQNATFMGRTWTSDNTNAPYPILSRDSKRNTWNYNINDINVNNCWYARAKTIQLGYTLPDNLLKKIKVNNLRVWISGDNLFAVSNVKDGFDPELGANSNQGHMDVFAKTVSFGLDLTF